MFCNIYLILFVNLYQFLKYISFLFCLTGTNFIQNFWGVKLRRGSQICQEMCGKMTDLFKSHVPQRHCTVLPKHCVISLNHRRNLHMHRERALAGHLWAPVLHQEPSLINNWFNHVGEWLLWETTVKHYNMEQQWQMPFKILLCKRIAIC